MAAHLSNTKPSFKQILFNKLGLVDLPIRVNCWFCNSDSYLLPGSKNTVDHWYCHLCENTNATDSNGEILDPSIIEINRSRTDFYATPKTHTSTNRRTASTGNSLCESCQNKQGLIYHLLSEYIPDENDPDYQFKCDNAHNYEKELHRRHPICDDCQQKITGIVEDQYKVLKMRQVNENMSASQIYEEKADSFIRPKTCTLWIKGTVFCLVHATTIGILWMAIWYYPYQAYDYFLQYDFIEWLRYDSWGECLEHLILENGSALLQKGSNSLLALVHCTLVNDIDRCSWTPYDYPWTIVALNLASFYIYNWHYILHGALIYEEHLKCWETYKMLQHVLSAIRLISTTVLFIVEDNITGQLLVSIAFALYISIHVISFLLVKRANTFKFAYMLKRDDSRANTDTQVQRQEQRMSNNGIIGSCCQGLATI
ncbi:Integral inner nuclear membrane protein ima1 [Choanephora cucurbitarum]|uniref:Integral inner nuclear membrane protein ima1 n=1 Tax=Choanephora cucurbitarum TaxID=101091 RepID=A0A1C7N939_9FUNG|nr:Integral inner nuclear membrane protein ima1 [Choanephora cucurbitarum]